ncbi:MAG: hypothetical protein AB7U05_12250 [Mangrovibacterium sp.]
MNDRVREYEKLLAHDQQCASDAQKSIQQLVIWRLATFSGIVLSFIYLAHPLNWLSAAALLILFLYLVKVFIKKEKVKKLHDRLMLINQQELEALKEQYSQFENGSEFIDPHHAYSFDLDLYGEGGLFQFLNRTTTQLGRKKLASWLNTPLLEPEKLKERQTALQELATYTRWRQYFAAKGQTHDEQDLQLLQQIAGHEALPKPELVRRLIFVLPFISIVFLTLLILGIIPWGVFLLPAIINAAVLYAYRKTIGSFYQLYGNQSNLLKSYTDLLRLIEQKEFQSPLLQSLKQQLSSHSEKASQIVNELRRIMARFDYRANLVFALVAEPLFVWDLVCIYQLDRWHRKYGKNINDWFAIMAEFDALSSLANLNHNQVEWALPTFEDGAFCFSANDLAHPLINSSKRIGNDFRMNGEGKICLITGANMAGKSTFLRTIGINMILALNGCRVCASWLTLKPTGLFTNMRTTDNLQKDESYFLAELLRLKQMLDQIESGQPLFIIIDEMLKGTNSEDKLSGSKALTAKLIRLNANGLVATHDLALTELEKSYPAQISNKCFEVTLENDQLTFDYKLRDGVTSTMNASFLMRKMGITD